MIIKSTFIVDLELIRCAQANFENFERMVPAIKNCVYYKIARAQLDEALGGRKVEEALKIESEHSPSARVEALNNISGEELMEDSPGGCGF